jgi:hypothetical protein
MSDRAINNPEGAFGLTADFPQSASPYESSAAVTAKKVVAIGTTGKVAVAATDGTASLCIGISRDAIASGSTGLIIERGIVTGVVADGTITAGLLLKRSTNTTGAVMATATPAVGEVIAFAIAASAAGVVDVYVSKANALS